MTSFTLYLIITALLTIILSIIGQTTPLHNPDLNKLAPYECGFDPINSPRLPFSFRFFLIAILFLLFDLEIALLLPLPLSFTINNSSNSTWFFSIFMIILTFGLLYEWIKGGLDWAND
uniref:NADH-ubiquinone oxidoreductase chain 3 n=1 Tax=Ophiocreas oedipus TaxID=876696 RepID=A0A8K1RSQ9_9ECHI|nr:NADH dehydrogenase subunit 3 [Ophiocreas oedipus]